MSYILDALQRSQKERELGQVPALGSTQHTERARTHAHPSPWVLVSVTLGIVAVALALYAALSQKLTSVHPASAPVAQVMAPPTAPQPAPASMPKARPQTTAAAEPTRPGSGPGPERPPISQSAVPQLKHPIEAGTTADPPRIQAEKPVPPVMAALPAPEPAQGKQKGLMQFGSNLPKDLLGDIQNFKRRVEREEQTKVLKAMPGAPANADPEYPLVVKPSRTETEIPQADPKPPRLHALPAQIQKGIPAHRISVHVYAEEPADRFIILNSRRMGEGEINQDGLRVESIRPRGVVLSYQGNRFFNAR